MDYPLGDQLLCPYGQRTRCLNPYSNGLPSRGTRAFSFQEGDIPVLIPILMDYPLGAISGNAKINQHGEVLIPILMDYPLGDDQETIKDAI